MISRHPPPLSLLPVSRPSPLNYSAGFNVRLVLLAAALSGMASLRTTPRALCSGRWLPALCLCWAAVVPSVHSVAPVEVEKKPLFRAGNDLILDEDRGLLYVVGFKELNVFKVVDSGMPEYLTLLSTIMMMPGYADTLAYGKDGAKEVVFLLGEKGIAVADTTDPASVSLSYRAFAASSASPCPSLVLSPTGTHYYVCCQHQQFFVSYSVSSGLQIGREDLDGTCLGLVADSSDRLLVTTPAGVEVFTAGHPPTEVTTVSLVPTTSRASSRGDDVFTFTADGLTVTDLPSGKSKSYLPGTVTGWQHLAYNEKTNVILGTDGISSACLINMADVASPALTWSGALAPWTHAVFGKGSLVFCTAGLSITVYSYESFKTTDAPPTDAPPTDAPPTDAPPTNAPPTDAPPTDAPPTDAPPTNAPPTDAPPTNAPPTDAPPTDSPPTDAPPTDAPPTMAPPTDAPPTDAPPTGVPPTNAPPTGAPPTDAPPTNAPPTDAPPTNAPPTDAPTAVPTDAPPTDAPQTNAPTEVPMVDALPSDAPPTDAPTAGASSTDVPRTRAPPTSVPETNAPPTDAPPTDAPPTNAPPTSVPQKTDAPSMQTDAPTNIPPTNAPPTQAPPTNSPVTDAPPTDVPPPDVPPTLTLPETNAPPTDAPPTAAPPTNTPTAASTDAPPTDSPPTQAPSVDPPTDVPAATPTTAPTATSTGAPGVPLVPTAAPTAAPDSHSTAPSVVNTDLPASLASDTPATNATNGPDAATPSPAAPTETEVPGVSGNTTAPLTGATEAPASVPGAGTGPPIPTVEMVAPPYSTEEEIGNYTDIIEEPIEKSNELAGALAVAGTLAGLDPGHLARLVVSSSVCYPTSDMKYKESGAHGARVPFTLNPTGMTINGHPAYAMVLCNIGITAAFSAMCYGLFKVANWCGYKRMPKVFEMFDSLGFLRYPSAPLLVYQYLYQGTALGGLILLINSSQMEAGILKYILGLGSTIVALAVPVYLFVKTLMEIPARGYFVVDRRIGSSSMKHRLLRLFIGNGEWVSTVDSGTMENVSGGVVRHQKWVNKYACVLRPFRQPVAWYCFLEYITSFALAAVHSFQPSHHIGCGFLKSAAALIFAILLFCEVYTRPHVKGRDTAVLVLTLTLQSVSLGIQAAGYFSLQSEATWRISMIPLMVAASLHLCKVALDVAAEVYIMLTGRRATMQREAERSQEDTKAEKREYELFVAKSDRNSPEQPRCYSPFDDVTTNVSNSPTAEQEVAVAQVSPRLASTSCTSTIRSLTLSRGYAPGGSPNNTTTGDASQIVNASPVSPLLRTATMRVPASGERARLMCGDASPLLAKSLVTEVAAQASSSPSGTWAFQHPKRRGTLRSSSFGVSATTAL